MTQRCGFVAVIGAPNAGKSTLINGWVGSKVSIVSPKVQTTRSLVRGIALHEQSQVIFIDTPGIFQPKKTLEKAMVSAAWQGTSNVDFLLLVVDASKRKLDQDTVDIIDRLAQEGGARRCILVLNKIDKAPREKLMALTQDLNDRISFEATFMVSALKENGIKDVLSFLAERVPEDTWHFPEDQVSDMPMRLLSAEITREKLFHSLYQELPYGLTVETEDWEDFKDGSIKISQIIYLARDNHKGIILGKGGSHIKEMGQLSRLELEDILGCRVHLKLFVKVQENWTEDSERYSIWGLDSSS